jgi:hypothetical protein
VKRVLELVQIAALATVIAVCVAICMLVLQVRHTLQDVSTRLTLDLDEAHRVLLESGLTAMEARKASADERRALPKLTAQTSQVMTSLDAELVALRHTTLALAANGDTITRSTTVTLEGVDATVRGLGPVLVQTKASIAALQPLEADLDARVNDPAIVSTLHHIDGTTAAMEASAKDVQQEVHAITHPGWARRCWGWALDVAHVFNPLVIWLGLRW